MREKKPYHRARGRKVGKGGTGVLHFFAKMVLVGVMCPPIRGSAHTEKTLWVVAAEVGCREKGGEERGKTQ